MCIITKVAITDFHMNVKRNTFFNENGILNYFHRQTELKVIKDHEAFLVYELMKDIQDISEVHGLEEPASELRHSNRPKIQFTKIGNKNVLYCSDVNPLKLQKLL